MKWHWYILVSQVLGALSATAGLIAGGDSLGGLFGGVLLCAMVAPAMWARLQFGALLLAALAMATGALAVWGRLWWVVGLLDTGAWLGAATMVFALLVAEAGISLLIRRAPWSRGSAAAVTALLVTAWLSAPLWLFFLLSDWPRVVQCLASVHPLFAINGVSGLENWTEVGFAYHLMDLNQDVPFGLPQTVWPAVAVHVAIGVVAVAPVLLRRARKGSAVSSGAASVQS